MFTGETTIFGRVATMSSPKEYVLVIGGLSEDGVDVDVSDIVDIAEALVINDIPSSYTKKRNNGNQYMLCELVPGAYVEIDMSMMGRKIHLSHKGEHFSSTDLLLYKAICNEREEPRHPSLIVDYIDDFQSDSCWDSYEARKVPVLKQPVDSHSVPPPIGVYRGSVGFDRLVTYVKTSNIVEFKTIQERVLTTDEIIHLLTTFHGKWVRTLLSSIQGFSVSLELESVTMSNCIDPPRMEKFIIRTDDKVLTFLVDRPIPPTGNRKVFHLVDPFYWTLLIIASGCGEQLAEKLSNPDPVGSSLITDVDSWLSDL